MYFRNLYTKEMLVKVPTRQLPGGGQEEQSVTPVRLGTDSKTKAIYTVDERGKRREKGKQFR